MKMAGAAIFIFHLHKFPQQLKIMGWKAILQQERYMDFVVEQGS